MNSCGRNQLSETHDGTILIPQFGHLVFNLRKYKNANVKYLIRLNASYNSQLSENYQQDIKICQIGSRYYFLYIIGKNFEKLHLCYYNRQIKRLFNSFSTYC